MEYDMKKRLVIVQAKSKPGNNYVKVTPEIAERLQELVDSIDEEIENIYKIIEDIKRI